MRISIVMLHRVCWKIDIWPQREKLLYKNFNGFFDNYLGGEYKKISPKTQKIYEILRCGMAHGYFSPKNCTIAMLGKKSLGMKFEKDRYFFVIERYFEDFKKPLINWRKIFLTSPNTGQAGPQAKKLFK